MKQTYSKTPDSLEKSDHPQITEGLANRFYKFEGETSVLESLFNKVETKERLQHRCFPVKFAKYLRTPFFAEHL